MRPNPSKYAETTDVSFKDNLDAPVKWRIGKDSSALFYTFIALVIVAAALFVVSKPPAGTPFVRSLLDLLNDKSAWVIPRLQEQGWTSYWLAAAFIVLLTFLLFQLLFSTLYSNLEEEFIRVESGKKDGGVKNEAVRFVRTFSLQWPWSFKFPANYRSNGQRKFLRSLFVVVFGIMLISNVLLFVYFYSILAGGTPQLTAQPFPILYFTAIASRLVALFLAVCTVLQYAYHDFGVRVRNFFSANLDYFYPTIISVAIIAFVFSKMGQFDAFFIELVQSPVNLFCFAFILFPVSIAVIWFGPEYSYFTDQNFANRFDSWNLMRRSLGEGEERKPWIKPYGWLFLHERLFENTKDAFCPEEPPRYYLPLDNKEISPPTRSFYIFARSLGIVYILTLIMICANIFFGNLRGGELMGTLLPLVSLLFAAWYWFRGNGVQKSAELTENLSERVVSENVDFSFRPMQWLYDLRDRNVAEQEKKIKVYFVKERWPFWLGLIALVTALALLVVTFYHSIQGASWEVTFGWFLAFLFFSLIAFTWLLQFYGFYRKYTFDASLRLNYTRDETDQRWLTSRVCRGEVGKWDKWLDAIGYSSIQLMLLLFVIVSLMFGVFFGYSLFRGDFLSSLFLQFINPLNIYLLLINGFICLLMLGNRSLKIRELSALYDFYQNPETKDKKYHKMSFANFYRGILVVGLVLGYVYYGNSYHEVRYRASTEQSEKASLLAYTEKYVNRNERSDTLKPIILISADGGGLKACYWTMLQLYRLDSLGLFDDQVFMMSGASGGNMGLSMYTYLKAQRGITKPQIREIIQQIGESNFLSGDFTGLVTRFPINFLPELPDWKAHVFEDRSEAMAQAYFNLVGQDPNGYDYKSIRQKPYSWIWEQTDYELPLFVSNTTRAEDGMRAYVHPFSDERIAPGMIDLSVKGDEEISFPDAAFLANRFPIMSPAGRIEGRGHFVDAGNSDNSGISTIIHFLEYMNSRSNATKDEKEREIWRRFFSHDIILLSIRNDKTRFIRDEFYSLKERLNRNFYRSELSANTNAALNSGLVGVANYWDDYLRSAVRRDLGLISSYYYLDLPFYLTEEDVHHGLNGQLVYPMLDSVVSSINLQIDSTLLCHEKDGGCFSVAPPLGRLMAKPSLDYMAKMVNYPHNALVFKKMTSPTEHVVPLIEMPKPMGLLEE